MSASSQYTPQDLYFEALAAAQIQARELGETIGRKPTWTLEIHAGGAIARTSVRLLVSWSNRAKTADFTTSVAI